MNVLTACMSVFRILAVHVGTRKGRQIPGSELADGC